MTDKATKGSGSGHGRASQGDVWWVDLDPTRGREQHGRRPAVVVSVDPWNHGRAELVIVAPFTTKEKGIPTHVRTADHGFVKCEDVRSISVERLLNRKGRVTSVEMAQVQDRLRLLLGL